MKQLGFEVSGDELEIPEEYKEIVRKHVKYAKPESYVSWEDTHKQLKTKRKKLSGTKSN